MRAEVTERAGSRLLAVDPPRGRCRWVDEPLLQVAGSGGSRVTAGERGVERAQ